MINVNLRPNLKRKRAGSPLKGIGESLRGLGTRIKDPLLLVAVLSCVGVAGFLGFVLVSTTRELAVGIERAAAFLQSSSRSAGGIGRIFTTGGGARIPRLNKVLSDRLRIPVQLANPIEKLQVADGVFDTLPVDEVAPLLMLPIGLALRSAA